MNSPAETYPLHYMHEAPERPFDPSGLFWLEPSALQDVDKLINMTQMPTMSLGTGTRAAEFTEAREELAAIMVGEHDVLREELHRALDIGFMYGGLTARHSRAIRTGEAIASTEAAERSRPLPETLRASLEAVQPMGRHEDGGHPLFTRLRDVEVALAHSDILAFSLAATQDHMAQQFAVYHASGKELSRADIDRLQSTYYAGALAGALMTSRPQDLEKPAVEVFRTMRAQESAAIRLQFDPEDNLADTLDYALRTKLLFDYVEPGDGEPSYVIAAANGFQFAPNTLAMPILIHGVEEPELSLRIPSDEVEALIIRRIDPDSGEHGNFAITADTSDYRHANDDGRIVGVLLEDGCVSSYDRTHPNAAVIHGLAARAKGIDPSELSYSSTFAPSETQERRGRLGRLVLPAALAAPWLLDGMAELSKAGAAHWEKDAVADALILAAYVAWRGLNRRFEHQVERSDAHYQQALDQITGQR